MPLDADERGALLQYTLHEETVLGERSGMFLLVASILLLGLADLRDTVNLTSWHQSWGLALGIIFALIWFGSLYRQFRDLSACIDRLREWPLYAECKKACDFPGRGFIAQISMYLLPLLFLALWYFLLHEPITIGDR